MSSEVTIWKPYSFGAEIVIVALFWLCMRLHWSYSTTVQIAKCNSKRPLHLIKKNPHFVVHMKKFLPINHIWMHKTIQILHHLIEHLLNGFPTKLQKAKTKQFSKRFVNWWHTKKTSSSRKMPSWKKTSHYGHAADFEKMHWQV